MKEPARRRGVVACGSPRGGRGRRDSARRARPVDHVAQSTAEPGWLTVQIAPDRTAEVNRTLANASIYAAGLESGNDLEELFLSLTHDPSAVDPDGTFAGMAGRPTTGIN